MAKFNVPWRFIQQNEFPPLVEHHRRGKPYVLPIPAESMRIGAGTGDLDFWYPIGEAWAQLVSYFLPPNPAVLDMGCHCGRMARFFFFHPAIRYVGVDVWRPGIEWCQEHLSPQSGGRLTFEWADVYAMGASEEGKLRAQDYRFPLADGSMDMVLAASLFTHLVERDSRHYLKEVGRVLKEGGGALISLHIEPKAGEKFSGDEWRVDVDPEYFLQLADEASLAAAKIIGEVYGQHVILFRKDSAAKSTRVAAKQQDDAPREAIPRHSLIPRETVRWQRLEQTDFSPQEEPHGRGAPFSLPIPPASLRIGAGTDKMGMWYAIGEAWAELVCRFLPPDPTVLDIGCHAGRMARFLYLHPQLKYVGIDVSRPAIEWCQQHLAPLSRGRFYFVWADLHSAAYNPRGGLKACDYHFPMGPHTVDMVVAASLFTHLLEPDCRHYLREVSRVLKDDGGALISLHIEPKRGKKYSGKEDRIDVDPEYFIRLANQAGLVAAEIIGDVYGQQVILFRKDS